MSVDLNGKRLCIDGAEVELTAREWLVLECLVRRVGQSSPRSGCSRLSPTPTTTSRPTPVEVHISRLRSQAG
jgi:DNA-binding response OmpR family regulator